MFTLPQLTLREHMREIVLLRASNLHEVRCQPELAAGIAPMFVARTDAAKTTCLPKWGHANFSRLKGAGFPAGQPSLQCEPEAST